MKTIISQWCSLKRQKVYLFSCVILYIFLALFDNRNGFFVANLDAQIYRHIFQQLFIVFGNILFTMCVLNEQFFDVYENMLKLYLKNEKQFFFYLMLVLYGATVVPFLLGQSLYFCLSFYTGNFISVKLWLINMLLVMFEILITINLSAALNLFIKKNMLVYISYYLIIFTMMITGNVYTALPMTMKILETQQYYYTFGVPLWIGRFMLLVISTVVLYLGVRFFLGRGQEKYKKLSNKNDVANQANY